MKKLIILLATLFIITNYSAFTGNHSVKIATIGPMSGLYIAFGEQMKTGAKVAVRDINSNGGVNGTMIELIAMDDTCDPKKAIEIANDLAKQGVVFVAGHFCSDASIAASSVYNKNEIIQISPASSKALFTDNRPGPYIFRISAREDLQAKIAGKYLFDNYKENNVAIIHDNTEYGKDLADTTKEVFEGVGGNTLLYESFQIPKGEVESENIEIIFSKLITKLKEKSIDTIYFGGFHKGAALLISEIRAKGMDAKFISGDALITSEYWSITGDAGNGTLITFIPDSTKDPKNKIFIEKLKNEGITPENYVLYTYAAIQLWASAANAAGTNESKFILDALNSLSYNTIIGEISFDDKGDVNLPGYVWYVLENGKYNYIKNFKN